MTATFDGLFYQQLFEATPHPYLIVRACADFPIVAVNDRYLQATGTRRETMVGRGLFEVFPDNPDDSSASSVSDLRISLNRVIADRCADIMGVQKYDIPRRDGSNTFEVKYWSPVNTPVFNREGTLAYIVHHVEDITEFILNRERISRENAEKLGKVEDRAERMEAEVMRRAAEVKEANRALKSAMEELARLNARLTDLDRLKSEFFANVSHELRTPLTLLLAPLERRLQESDRHPLPERERRETEIMLRNCRLLYRHVTDLLDGAKLDSGRMTLEYARIDLAALTRVMGAHFESLAMDKGIEYRLQMPATLVMEADSEKVERILLNLLSNAFKFTPHGGHIRLHLEQEGENALIEVADSGPGIPADLRKTVFARFSQGEGGTRRRFGGTGLGLAIAREFASLHGGGITIADSPEGGALFLVSLPLKGPKGTVLAAKPGHLDPVLDRQAREELRSEPADTPAPGAAEGPLILVVEDNPDLNEFIVNSLRPAYRVASAFNGREGVGQALALGPDLILADVMMPEMSGDQMVAEVRRHADLADVPIVMLTAKADDALRLQLLKSGVQEYLTKPFSVEELLARVGGLVADRRRSLAQLRASEAKYRSLFKHMLNSLARCRLLFHHQSPVDYEYIEVNQAFEHLTGLKEVRGVKASETDPQTGFCTPELLDRFGRVAATGEPAQWEQYLPGHETWFRFGCFSPGPDEVVIECEDITARKQAQEQLEAINRELELRVEQRTLELQETREKYLHAGKLSAIGKLSASIAHEFNNPLQGIVFTLKGLKKRALLEPEDRELLDAAIGETDRIKELIRSLQDFNRPSTSRRVFMDVHQSLDSILLLHKNDFKDKRIAVAVDYAQQLPPIMAVPDQIKQVFLNLLTNAAEACQQPDGAITVSTRLEDDKVAVAIRDTGVGIAPEAMEHIFRPFFTTKPEVKGTGLGLSISYGIVNDHRGEIRVESAPGQGATFTVLLPAAAHGAAAIEPPQ